MCGKRCDRGRKNAQEKVKTLPGLFVGKRKERPREKGNLGKEGRPKALVSEQEIGQAEKTVE